MLQTSYTPPRPGSLGQSASSRVLDCACQHNEFAKMHAPPVHGSTTHRKLARFHHTRLPTWHAARAMQHALLSRVIIIRAGHGNSTVYPDLAYCTMHPCVLHALCTTGNGCTHVMLVCLHPCIGLAHRRAESYQAHGGISVGLPMCVPGHASQPVALLAFQFASAKFPSHITL